MLSSIIKTLEYSKELIISPDIDGFFSAELLNRKYGSVVVGTYDKNILCLADGVDPKTCLFVDCDMNTKDYVSIGNHMRLQYDNMADLSFNPNRFYETKNYWQKYPYATCFLISAAIGTNLEPNDLQRMAHADSTYLNMIKYGNNMRSWSSRLRVGDVEDIINQRLDLSDMQTRYPEQSFASRRFGHNRYIDTLNEALYNEKLSFAPLSTGVKYLSDKVGINTVVRYNKDIISYAEIYTDEYSVTYEKEVLWK